MSRTRRSIYLLLGIVVSLVFIVLLVRKIDWADFVRELGHVSWSWAAISLFFFSLNLVLRGVRWRLLLKNRVVLGDALIYLTIGYMSNNLLPAKIGEIVRLVLLGEKKRMSKSFIGATIVVERVVDLLSLLFFVALIPLLADIPASIGDGTVAVNVNHAIVIVEGATLLAAILLAVLASRRGSDWLLAKLSRFQSHRWLGKVAGGIVSFVDGLQVLQLNRGLIVVMVQSVLAWAVAGLSISTSLRAFSLQLPWYAAVFIMVVYNIGAMLPSAPGSIGVAHFMLVASLSVWSVDQSVALSFAVVHHGIRYVWITALGLLALWREGIGLSQLARLGE